MTSMHCCCDCCPLSDSCQFRRTRGHAHIAVNDWNRYSNCYPLFELGRPRSAIKWRRFSSILFPKLRPTMPTRKGALGMLHEPPACWRARLCAITKVRRPNAWPLAVAFCRYGRDEAQARVASTSKDVYVGNLAFVTTDYQLHSLFSRCGPIERVVMGLNKATQQPAGFAFIM